DRNSGYSPMAIANARGEYALAVPRGRYWIYASRPGYGAPVDAGRSLEPTVDVRRADLVRHDLELAAMRRASGRIVDEDGVPVAGALVMLGWAGAGVSYQPFEALASTYQTDGSVAESATGPDGRFTLALPDTGEQASSSSAPSELLAFKKGYAAGHSRLSPALASEAAVITLPPGVTLHGP